jgi:hypothetical protein
MSCISTSREKTSVNGIWHFKYKNGLYWEELFLDSIGWMYSAEVGVSRFHCNTDSQNICKTNEDGSNLTCYYILKMNRNSIKVVQDGMDTLLFKRIKKSYNYRLLIEGNDIELSRYRRDYYERKARTEQ